MDNEETTNQPIIEQPVVQETTEVINNIPSSTNTEETNPNGSTGRKGIDWAAAKAFYMDSFINTYADVAKKFNVSKTTVERKGSEESWVEARQKLGEKAVIEFESNKILEIAKANASHLRTLRYLLSSVAIKMSNGVLKPSEMSSIASALKIAIEGERLILGLPTNNTKSEIMGKLSTDLNLPEDTLKKMDSFFKDESA